MEFLRFWLLASIRKTPSEASVLKVRNQAYSFWAGCLSPIMLPTWFPLILAHQRWSDLLSLILALWATPISGIIWTNAFYTSASMRQRYLASRWGMNDPQLNLAAAKAGGDERASFFDACNGCWSNDLCEHAWIWVFLIARSHIFGSQAAQSVKHFWDLGKGKTRSVAAGVAYGFPATSPRLTQEKTPVVVKLLIVLIIRLILLLCSCVWSCVPECASSFAPCTHVDKGFHQRYARTRIGVLAWQPTEKFNFQSKN